MLCIYLVIVYCCERQYIQSNNRNNNILFLVYKKKHLTNKNFDIYNENSFRKFLSFLDNLKKCFYFVFH